MSNLSVSQRFRPPCDDGKERVTCVLCGAVHETWVELSGNRADDPRVVRRGCACSMCRGQSEVCPECAEKLEWSLSVLLMAKAKKWNLFHHELVNEDAQILFDMINNIEL